MRWLSAIHYCNCNFDQSRILFVRGRCGVPVNARRVRDHPFAPPTSVCLSPIVTTPLTPARCFRTTRPLTTTSLTHPPRHPPKRPHLTETNRLSFELRLPRCMPIGSQISVDIFAFVSYLLAVASAKSFPS